jgi:ribonuclease HI
VLEPDLCIYTDGSKSEEGCVGSGWIIAKDDYVVDWGSRRLMDKASVFQAEAVAIKEVLLWILAEEKHKTDSIQIWSDSQAAIAAILGVNHRSKVTKECAKLLAVAQESRCIQLAWIRGHAENTGNEVADMLAKTGTGIGLDLNSVLPVPVSYVKKMIDHFYLSEWERRWRVNPKCAQTKEMIPKVNHGHIKKFLGLGRQELARFIQIVTGHGLLAYHLSKWRPDVEPTCRLCHEGDEKFTHLLRECPTLAFDRYEFWGRVNKSNGPVAFELNLIKFFSLPRIEALYYS